MNHLQFESSPYLRQHAGNPVDWYPWGEAAFGRARRENKLIFLSIGYATCHWCHVMERESFESAEIADLLNANFIAIKVDREERLDIDAVYMSAVTAIRGQGGWPLSVFLTPDKEPFFGGTYFPPEPLWGLPGFGEILRAIDQNWRTRPEQIIVSGQQLASRIRQTRPPVMPSDELNIWVLDDAFSSFSLHFDQTCAGMGEAPKFPAMHNLCFLLRYYRRTGKAPALDMAEKTLIAMSRGGICDQLGGGFHRYSTDRQWRVPHFEKMLYDQALALRGYLEAFQVTRKKEYIKVVEELAGYVLRDLRHPRGAFFSAEDADSPELDARGRPGSEKKEGAFYLWSVDEVAAILGPEVYSVVEYVYGLKFDGNTLSDPHQQFDSRNIFYQARTLEEAAERFQLSSLDIQSILDSARQQLLDVRSRRPRAFLDDKILTDWNALMIGSLAVAGAVFERPDWIMDAETAMRFLLEEMLRADGRLWHRYRDGQAGIEGMLDDYAFMASALLDLFEVTGSLDYLRTARQLIQTMNDLFWDSSEGGYFLTARDSEPLITRPKIVYDGAIPSGNSMAALALSRLYHLTLDSEYNEQLIKLFQCFAAEVRQHPTAYSQLLSVLDFTLGSVCEILLAPAKSLSEIVPFQREIWTRFLPNKVVRVRPVDSAALEEFFKLMPDARDSGSIGERLTVYVCANKVCYQPVFSVSEMVKLLEDDYG